jgi:uncharacterized coiled-coil protein SlyX
MNKIFISTILTGLIIVTFILSGCVENDQSYTDEITSINQRINNLEEKSNMPTNISYDLNQKITNLEQTVQILEEKQLVTENFNYRIIGNLNRVCGESISNANLICFNNCTNKFESGSTKINNCLDECGQKLTKNINSCELDYNKLSNLYDQYFETNTLNNE